MHPVMPPPRLCRPPAAAAAAAAAVAVAVAVCAVCVGVGGGGVRGGRGASVHHPAIRRHLARPQLMMAMRRACVCRATAARPSARPHTLHARHAWTQEGE